MALRDGGLSVAPGSIPKREMSICYLLRDYIIHYNDNHSISRGAICMTPVKILVVEDERIVATDFQQRLNGMGYWVPVTAGSSQDALRKAAETRPDLVLMDISLEGYVDGIEVAGKLREMLDVLPIYLTAYSDPLTLARANVTEPLGYIVKPFDNATLSRTIEMALHRRQRERQLKQSVSCLKSISLCVSEGLIAADENGRILLINPAAEGLTGWSRAEGLTRGLFEIFRMVNDETGRESENPARAACEKCAGIALTGNLLARSGHQVPISGTAAPILDDIGNCTGVVVAFKKLSAGSAVS